MLEEFEERKITFEKGNGLSPIFINTNFHLRKTKKPAWQAYRCVHQQEPSKGLIHLSMQEEI